MGKLRFDLSVSLDGFVAGPNPSLKDPLGVGGEKLHEWVVGTAAFRERDGEAGGETGVDSDVMAESARNIGATVVGRRMFSGGQGPWEDDPNPNASWWGDDPPFHHPVFVLTHHARQPVTMKGGTTYAFVTTGIEDALAQARAAAGDKDVVIGGGADVARQYLRAGWSTSSSSTSSPCSWERAPGCWSAYRASPSCRSSAPRCWSPPRASPTFATAS
jgi:dihydrofolate reductase